MNLLCIKQLTLIYNTLKILQIGKQQISAVTMIKEDKGEYLSQMLFK